MSDESTVQTTAPNEFWERPSVLGARHALDVWASWKWSRFTGAPVPTLEDVFEFPRALLDEWFDAQSQLRQLDVELGQRAGAKIEHPADRARLIALAVDVALANLGAGAVAVGLLLELYPRTGTYQRPVYTREYSDPASVVIRGYRPDELAMIVAGIRSQHLQRRCDSILHQLHRESVAEIAAVCALPSEIFAAPIVRISAPRLPKRKRRIATDFETELVEIPKLDSKRTANLKGTYVPLSSWPQET